MTATETLRQLLDERGVEYRFKESTKVFEWHFDGTDGEGSAHATEVNGGINIIACSLTPEQAVEATLGRGTCHTVSMDCFGNPPFNQSGLNGNSTACGCSECGAPWSTVGLFRGNQLKHNFKACPICGRKVES